MLPTLNYSGDVLLIEHLSHRLGKLEPGDIVLVRSPVEPRKIVAKRIVGMEGDRTTTISIRTVCP
ncbi:Mitochondrial inner membrane protease subunit 1 [Linum grandiflorum]